MIVGGRAPWPQQEGGLAEIGPVGDRLHLRIVEAIRLGDDSQRIAFEWYRGEHVELMERQFAHACVLNRARTA
jgi:hypothetical protein